MTNHAPLIKKIYTLQKFPGKGGWTYATIPEIAKNPNNPFGWVKVRGRIDDYELNHYKLMPQGNGKLFLPVKASIRKIIKKEAGDTVYIELFLEDREVEIPQEIIDCLHAESSEIKDRFYKLSEESRKRYLDWIYAAKTDDTKTDRIVQMLNELDQ